MFRPAISLCHRQEVPTDGVAATGNFRDGAAAEFRTGFG